MRKLMIALLILCAGACNGQALRFSEPTWDYTVLPNASTTLLMHFENDYTDLGGGTWQNAANGWSGFDNSVYKFGSYSAYHQTAFNTTQHYFYSTTATEAVEVGAGDFTLEFWAGINVITSAGSPSNDILAVNFITGAAGAYFRVYNTYSGTSYVPGLRFQDSGGTNFSGIYAGHGYFSGLNWFHCCFERRSGTLYGYINGQQVIASAMAYEPVSITEVDVVAFNRTYLAAKFYIDELRVFKGGYVYGGAFTPPTRPIGLEKPMRIKFSDPMIDTTQLPDASTTILLHFDNNFTDLGGNTWANTTFGTFSDTVKKFGTHSCETGTSGFLLSNTASAAVAVGTGDFTCEYWFNAGNITGPNDTGTPIVKFRFYNVGTGYFTGEAGFFKNSATTFVPAIYATGYFFSPAIFGKATESYLISGSEWFHFCFERRSGILYAYIDGKLIGSATMAGDYTTVSAVDITKVSEGTAGFSGDFYIDELRFFKKGYVYGGEFTPPAKPFGLKKTMSIKF